MKRIFILTIVAAMFMAAPLYAADINIGGEFEATGICHRNWDYDSNVDDHSRMWAGVLVISLEAKVTEKVTVFGSFTLADRNWGDTATASHPVEQATDDVAYAMVDLDSFTVTAGRQLDEWGHMLMAGGDGIDRFTLSTELGGIGHAIFADKIEERDQPDLKDDIDRYGIQISRDSEEAGFGLYLWHAMSNGIVNTAGVEKAGDMNGYGADIYYSGSLGPVGLSAELAYIGGDAETEYTATTSPNGWTYGKDTAGKARTGLFITAEMEMEPMTLSGTLAYAKDRFVAGPYFNPTLMTGTDQDTAIYEFGQLLAEDGSKDGDTAMLIALGMDYALSDKWAVGGKVASHTFANDADLTGTEVDLQVEYTIDEGATWGLYAGYLSPDGFKKAGLTAEDDSAIAVVQSLAIEF